MQATTQPRQAGIVERTVRSSALIILGEVLALPTGLVTAAMLSRTLGPQGYALFTIASTAIILLELCLISVLFRAAVPLIAASDNPEQDAERILRLFALTGILGTAGLWLAAKPLAVALHTPDLTDPLRLFSFQVLISALAQGYRAVLIGLGRFGRRAVGGAIRWIARMVLIVGFLLLGWGIEGAVWASMAAGVIELFFSAAGSHLRPWRGLDLFSARVMLQVLGPLTVSGLALRISERADLFILKLLGSTDVQAGIYGAAQNLTFAIVITGVTVASVGISVIPARLRDDAEHEAIEVADALGKLPFLVLPLIAILAGSAGSVLRLVYGAAFESGHTVLALLLASSFGGFVLGTEISVLTGLGKIRRVVDLSVANLIAGLALEFVFTWWMGVEGTALGSALAQLACAAASFVLVRRLTPVPLPMGQAQRMIPISAMFFFVSAYIPAAGLMIPVKLALLAMCCFGILWAMPDFRRHDWPLLRSLIAARAG